MGLYSDRTALVTLIGYARVSTSDQNLDSQLDALRDAGVTKRNIYIDKLSGKNRERPEFQRCMAELEEGDVLVVARMDRLGRSLIDLVNIVQEIADKGAGFKMLDKAEMDTTTPGGRLVFNLFASLAEYERELIVERTGAGLRAARERGRIGGRPPVTADDDKVKQVKQLHGAGLDVADVAKMTGLGRSTVYRYLSK
jgi:DNA invertase Pin-like site-specific DNA recombinase